VTSNSCDNFRELHNWGCMSESETSEIQAILRDVDQILRDRLKAAGVEIVHALIAMRPDGGGFVRSNVPTEDLGDMTIMLAVLVTKASIDETAPVH